MRILLLVAALALVPLVPAQAGATTTIGTNLSRVPDDRMVDCTTLPIYGVPTYQTTCTWYSTISSTENHIVPEGVGVITRARVRVGRTTGLMQFAVGRAQVDRNKPIGQQLLCCVWRASGPTFTPAPNSITEVTLNEPVEHVRDFQSNQDLFDNLALSILEPGVPIPAAPTVSGIGSTSTGGACWPAVQLGNTYCMPGGPGNYAVLFNADWELNLSNSVRLAAQIGAGTKQRGAGAAHLQARAGVRRTPAAPERQGPGGGGRAPRPSPTAAPASRSPPARPRASRSSSARRAVGCCASTGRSRCGPTAPSGAERHSGSSAHSSRSSAEPPRDGRRRQRTMSSADQRFSTCPASLALFR